MEGEETYTIFKRRKRIKKEIEDTNIDSEKYKQLSKEYNGTTKYILKLSPESLEKFYDCMDEKITKLKDKTGEYEKENSNLQDIINELKNTITKHVTKIKKFEEKLFELRERFKSKL